MIYLLKSWLKPFLVMVSTYTGIGQTHLQHEPRVNILDFPPEVLRMIFVEVGQSGPGHLMLNYHSDEAWLRRQTYSQLCLTNRHFLGEARRLLFSDMRSHLGSTHFKFLSMILEKPEYAAYVRTYHTPTQPHEERGHLLADIKEALGIMYSLKELVIRQASTYESHHRSTRQPTKGKYLKRILPKIPTADEKQALEDGKKRHPFQLHRFVWLATTRNPNEALNFLTTQDKLEYLGWGVDSPIPPKYARKISRKLIRLDASTPIIEALLPGRHITELQWDITDWNTRAPAPMQNIFRMPEFKELRVLSLLDIWRDPRKGKGTRLLRILRQLDIGPFPKLEVIYNHAASFTGPGARYLVKQDVPYNTLFPRLKHFLLVQLVFFDEHICLGADFAKLPENYLFLTHDHDMCENGTFVSGLDRMYNKYPLSRNF